MHKDPRDASLEDELARIRASFLKAAAVASAAAVPVATSAGGARAEVSVRQAAAQPLVAVPLPRPQSASARPHASAEMSRNSELYQVYVGSLKRPKQRKKSGSTNSGVTQHLAVRVPLAASRGRAEADDADEAGIDEDTGVEDDAVDEHIDSFLSAKSASASSGRSRRVASAPMTRASLDQSVREPSLPNPAARSAKELVLAFDASIRAEATKSIPNDTERRTWSELSWDDRLLLLQRYERTAPSLAAKLSRDVPVAVPRALKSRPASASHAQRTSFDWSSRPRAAASQLQRSQPDAAAALANKPQPQPAVIAAANPYNPYLTADCDASASRPRPSAESFLARVAAAAERTGGVNDALQLSMMRKRGEGRNVYVMSCFPLCIFVTFYVDM